MAQIEVFGGGIFGLSIAWALVKRGASVRLIEKRRIGAGASGGLVGALAPHSPDSWNEKKAFQFQSLVMAATWWDEVEAAGGLSAGYARTGRISVIPDEKALGLSRARIAQAGRNWQGQAAWDVQPDHAFAKWQVESPTGFVVRDGLSARISPRAACQALAAALRACGVEILEGAETGHGADVQVLATGHEGLADLSRDLDDGFGKGVKGQGALLEFDATDWPQLFVDGIHVVPHADGTTAIGSTSENDWADAETTDRQLDDLVGRIRYLCPALADAPLIGRWAGVRPRGRRRAPILGAHPARANVFIANGGFKIGFGVAPLAGEMLADLILTGKAEIPEGFRPEANLAKA